MAEVEYVDLPERKKMQRLPAKASEGNKKSLSSEQILLTQGCLQFNNVAVAQPISHICLICIFIAWCYISLRFTAWFDSRTRCWKLFTALFLYCMWLIHFPEDLSKYAKCNAAHVNSVYQLWLFLDQIIISNARLLRRWTVLDHSHCIFWQLWFYVWTGRFERRAERFGKMSVLW